MNADESPGVRTPFGAVPRGDVEQRVDSLAAELGRPVLLENAELSPIAYSRHDDDIDPVRLHSLLRQGVAPELMEAMTGAGVGSKRSAFWTPPLPRWQMTARLCIPIMAGEVPLGYLWISDPDRSMTSEQVRIGQHTANELAPILDRANVERRGAEKATQLLLRQLLDGEGDPAGAVADLVAHQGLPNEPTASVLVVEVEGSPAVQSGSPEAIDMALAVGSRLRATRSSARWLVYPSDRLVLLTVAAKSTVVDHLAAARIAREALGNHFGSRVTVGISGPPGPLERARSSRRQALAAWTVASSVDGTGSSRCWTELGCWRLLSRLVRQPDSDEDLVDDIHPGVIELLRDDRAILLSTLKTYFDHAGDATATAAALHLHRSTLYYRLEKISEITGMDLRSSDARFEMMLGLRVALIAGLRHGRE
jgi:PucR-like helix-turn-helix protein/diguanylate cyclase with GGDEF domain